MTTDDEIRAAAETIALGDYGAFDLPPKEQRLWLAAQKLADAYLNPWRPIASAPRDGTRVLLCGEWPTLPEGHRCPGVVIGHWAERWWVRGVPYNPTHWTPLPLPPAPAA